MNINCPICNKIMIANHYVVQCDLQQLFIPYFGFEVVFSHAKYFLRGSEVICKQIEIPPYVITIYDDFSYVDIRNYSERVNGNQYITSDKRILSIGYPLDLSNFDSEAIIKRIKTLILLS